MNNYKLLIQYDGGRYKGWQRLGNSDHTIQGKIEGVLSELVGRKIEVTGCSRTDAGVHALAQTANFKIRENLLEADINEYLNRYLPHDISVREVLRVPEDFHARFHAKDKTYLFKIWNEAYTNPFMRKYSMHIQEKLNISSMEKACRHFTGQHDFTAFSNAKSKKKSMIREIYAIDIVKDDGFIQIRVWGNGFLHNMVRRIVGILIAVGLGETDADTIPEIIASKERNQTGSLADACGLYLEKIAY